jgi:hypothetical protein
MRLPGSPRPAYELILRRIAAKANAAKNQMK